MDLNQRIVESKSTALPNLATLHLFHLIAFVPSLVDKIKKEGVTQLERVPVFETGSHRFKSCHLYIKEIRLFVFLCLWFTFPLPGPCAPALPLRCRPCLKAGKGNAREGKGMQGKGKARVRFMK